MMGSVLRRRQQSGGWRESKAAVCIVVENNLCEHVDVTASTALLDV
jgi:hypothetical protein